jgi:hypothetical protein
MKSGRYSMPVPAMPIAARYSRGLARMRPASFIPSFLTIGMWPRSLITCRHL